MIIISMFQLISIDSIFMINMIVFHYHLNLIFYIQHFILQVMWIYMKQMIRRKERQKERKN